jgi:hypothetical protein
MIFQKYAMRRGVAGLIDLSILFLFNFSLHKIFKISEVELLHGYMLVQAIIELMCTVIFKKSLGMMVLNLKFECGDNRDFNWSDAFKRQSVDITLGTISVLAKGLWHVSFFCGALANSSADFFFRQRFGENLT